MKLFRRKIWLAVGLLLVLTSWDANANESSQTVVLKADGMHRMVRNGKPYFVKGVGGHTNLAELAAAGANSIRTWGTDNLGEILDEAHKHGLTVTVGLWLGHERHGFDYQDQASVVRQLNESLETVQKYKDHPAVLMWGIGNEMEGSGTNPVIWYAVDHIARECKRIDPNHPTMTAIAELGESKIESIELFCPNIDIIGVNSYGGITTVGSRYRAAGGSKPYLITELGPLGPWETGKTSWGSPYEMSSTEKGKWYADGYRAAVTNQEGLCLGSYAFYWGHKQETTATWFGMLLPDGSRLAAVDTMIEAWTGAPPENLCPSIKSFEVNQTAKLRPGQSIAAKVSARDPEKDQLTYRWELRRDSGTIGSGGDAQSAEVSIEGAVVAAGPSATVTVPAGGGGYRLFAYVYDGQGGAAVANVPIYVEGPVTGADSASR